MATSALVLVAPAWAQTAPPAAPRPRAAPPSGDPDGPIIADDQFEAELPSLDPALGTPLEPLDQFQGRPPRPVRRCRTRPSPTIRH
jgi:hypothetical protein